MEEIHNMVLSGLKIFFSKHDNIEENNLDEFLKEIGLLEYWSNPSEKKVFWQALSNDGKYTKVNYSNAIKGLSEILPSDDNDSNTSSNGISRISRVSKVNPTSLMNCINRISRMSLPHQIKEESEAEAEQVELPGQFNQSNYAHLLSNILNEIGSDILRRVYSIFFVSDFKTKETINLNEINDYLMTYSFYNLQQSDIAMFLPLFAIDTNGHNEFTINRDAYNFFMNDIGEMVLVYEKSITQSDDNYTEDISLENSNDFFNEFKQSEEESTGCQALLFTMNPEANEEQEEIKDYLNRQILFQSTLRLQKIESIKSFISKQCTDMEYLEKDLAAMHQKYQEKQLENQSEEDMKILQHTEEINHLNSKIISRDREINILKEDCRMKEIQMGASLEKMNKLQKDYDDLKKVNREVREERDNYKNQYYDKLNECLANIEADKRNQEEHQKSALESKIDRDANPLFKSMSEFSIAEETKAKLQGMDFDKLLSYCIKVDIDNQKLLKEKYSYNNKQKEMTNELQSLTVHLDKTKEELIELKGANIKLENQIAELLLDIEHKEQFEAKIDPLMLRISRMSQLEPTNQSAKVISNMNYNTKNDNQMYNKGMIEEDNYDQKKMIGNSNVMYEKKDKQYNVNFNPDGGMTLVYNSSKDNDQMVIENDGDEEENEEDDPNRNSIDVNMSADDIDNVFQREDKKKKINNTQKKTNKNKLQDVIGGNSIGSISNSNSNSNKTQSANTKPIKKIKASGTVNQFITEDSSSIMKEMNQIEPDNLIFDDNESNTINKLKTSNNNTITNQSKNTKKEDKHQVVSSSIFKQETKEEMHLRIANRQNNHIFSYDFLALRSNTSYDDILKPYDDYIGDVFTDSIFIIDPIKNKKHKYNMIITSKAFYIIRISNNHIHLHFPRSDLNKLSISDHNSNFLCFHINNKDEVLLETFRRTEMIIFIRDYEIIIGNSQLRFQYQDTFTVTRNGKTITCIASTEKLVIPNFENAKKMGYLYLMKDVFFVHTFKEKFVVLTDVGLLVFDDLSGDPKYLPIINSTYSRCPEGKYKRALCFEIKIARKKDVYVFAAKNEIDFNAWMKEFEKIESHYKNTLRKLDTGKGIIDNEGLLPK